MHEPLREFPAWSYAAAFVSYVVLGLLFGSVFLNFVVGPLYLVSVLYVLPALVRRCLRPAKSVTEPRP